MKSDEERSMKERATITKEELKEICLYRFEKNFIHIHTPSLLQTNGETLLLDLLEETPSLPIPAAKREQVIFRAAYLLESLCTAEPERLERVFHRFIRLLLNTTNSGAKRSLSKIAATLLPQPLLEENAHEIATRCCEQIIEPHAKPAAQIWNMEILFKLTPYVEWLPTTIEELIETLRRRNLPSLRVRIKRWKNR